MNVVSIDIGLKRIGLAFASKILPPVVCSPILRKNRNQAASDVKKLLEEKNAQILVVGIPKGGASQEEMGRRITHFVGLLNFGGDVVYVDEYGSSVEAATFLHKSKNKDGKLDSIAALLILQRWIDAGSLLAKQDI